MKIIKMFSTGQYKFKKIDVTPIVELDTVTKDYIQHKLKGYEIIITLQRQEGIV